MKPPVDTIITDLDNTLYDWFKFWYASFGEMLRVLVEESGISAEEMKPEIRALHHKYGTSEYSALIQELPCLQKKFPGEDLPKRFGNAIEAYRRARKATLELLQEVSHWPQTAVDREKVLTTAQVSPTYVLHGNFAELLALFDSHPH